MKTMELNNHFQSTISQTSLGVYSSATSCLPDQKTVLQEIKSQKTTNMLQSMYAHGNTNHLHLPKINSNLNQTRNNLKISSRKTDMN